MEEEIQDFQDFQETQEPQENQETQIEETKIEVRNAQEIKDGFLSIEVKGLYGNDFCQYIFDPKTEQNEKLLEALKGVDVKPYVVDLEALKTSKLAELETKASAFENSFNKDMWFKSSVKGYLINGDRRTRSNIQDLITYQPTDIVIYRDYENIERNLTKDELKIMLKEHVMNGQMLYNQKWEFEKKINACTSVDELNKIELNFTMQDFSKNV